MADVGATAAAAAMMPRLAAPSREWILAVICKTSLIAKRQLRASASTRPPKRNTGYWTMLPFRQTKQSLPNSGATAAAPP
ncbi:hypothetical protein GCM10010989_25520 [Croceicoccus pelagius]|uniref:Uncharacterized protein n=1 Tax=Croceicoccus pelagius TaxID=1703341 RepID=A0A916YLK6_9SPHN|nr:hypothetical protein GCM10010989_25520 [Croceicoccus pelagius]